ncbi:hypothetical protein Pla52o_52310 [Novipirellula galeiformis]|uniref:LemA family protein n=2 Tax=Novipirellula galeiformis TaxID=2528004 RepID=A0A5C6C0C8_9BACT|nr:hypothetical protein Pla52o_52310 [Novipirellula galeiformis]
MIQIIAFLFAILLVVSIAVTVQGRRTISKMRRHCDLALENLIEAISREHLIVGHLLDALPKNFESARQIQLADAYEKSANALRELRLDTSNRATARILADEQCKLLVTSIQLQKKIQDDADVISRATIQGCVQGLSQAQEKAHAAMTSYNLAVVSMATHCELLIPSLVCRWTLRDACHRPLINWIPDGSSSSMGYDF